MTQPGSVQGSPGNELVGALQYGVIRLSVVGSGKTWLCLVGVKSRGVTQAERGFGLWLASPLNKNVIPRLRKIYGIFLSPRLSFGHLSLG